MRYTAFSPEPAQRPELAAWWSLPDEELLHRLGASRDGLTSREAEQRSKQRGPSLGPEPPARRRVLLAQFRSPIVLILLAAAVLSAGLRDATDALIILAIVAASAGLGFWQEWRASAAVAALLARVHSRASLLRDGRSVELSVEEVVPGDVVLLSAGSAVPGDCRILDANYLHAVESALTGETFPVEKSPGVAAADAPIARREGSLFLGTHVASGSARALVVRTGADTEFGAVSERLRQPPPETEFERGVRRFGMLLAEVTFVIVLGAFAINAYLGRPTLDSLLYSLALAVGLTPQLLPAVITVNLSHGARRLADAKVIVKRLAAIENLGSMDVLCCDKTGTLTEGSVRLHAALDPTGVASDRVLLFAKLNATLEAGFANPIDEAIRAAPSGDLSGYRKLGELPYDFVRKRLSVLAAQEGRSWLVTKGAVAGVLDVCSHAQAGDGAVRPLAELRGAIEGTFRALSAASYRCLGVAVRDLGAQLALRREDESSMTFLGFLAFEDPAKAGVTDALRELKDLGVSVRMITGDNRLVAETVAAEIGISTAAILTGAEIHRMSDEALRASVVRVAVFAEVEPSQKERILLAFRKAGHVVGFLGDGINDAPALHAADVGLSVDGAVDVAREAADLVLLERDLAVVAAGVREGRATFANTLKYVFMATSANFGNMFSLAGASALLPFLPLLPKQVLLTNLLTDLPEMAIAVDRVDAEWVERPHRFDLPFIRRFMLVFGALSSLFDFATFGVLWFVLRADADAFRTGWFVESVVSAATIVLLLRTRRSALASRPARALLVTTLAVCAATIALPSAPFAPLLGLCPLPPRFYALLGGIVGLYALAAELTKRAFYARHASAIQRGRRRSGIGDAACR